jgi:outer membrane lipoprotein-sorting protein
MNASCVRLFALLGLWAIGLAGVAGAAEPAIIAKARAQIGPDALLDSVKSIHYVGTLVGTDAAEPDKETTQHVEIFLRKPAQQRIVLTTPAVVEISGLDDYEAWRRTIDASKPHRWQQTQMGVEQVRQLRADVWQNLAFFRGIESVHGHVEDEGPATIDGIRCEKIAFYHSESLVYLRYFNQATGQLVYTGTPENNVREEGEVMVDGIRFPKTLVISQTSEGHTLVRRLTFEKITVNEDMPDSLFAVPLATMR